MKYYKIILDTNDINKFLTVCNKLDYVITSFSYNGNEYVAIYRSKFPIENLSTLYALVTEED